MKKFNLGEEDITEAEVALYEMVAKSLGLKISVEKKPTKTEEFKVLQGKVKCNLCGTLTIQHVKLIKYSDGIWKKNQDLSDEEAKEYIVESGNSFESKVKSCWNCFEMLKLKEKEELIQMIIDKHNPVITKMDIWRAIKDLKSSDSRALKGEIE